MPRRQSILKRSLLVSLATVLAAAAAVWFGGPRWLDDSVMAYEGETGLPGLDASVEVLFDERGIPRVYAETDADAMRALGWLHAGERLLQLELIRRLARGELSALVGEGAVELDILHRSFGFARRVADEKPDLDAEAAGLIDAYVEGINRQIDAVDRLPPGLIMLGAEPEPWTREDVLTIAYYQTFYPTTLVRRLSRAWHAITLEYGQPAADWLSELPEWTRSTLPRQSITKASNTWVVAPEKSESGAAMHASDPHLEIDRAPGTWYAVGLHSKETFDALGVTTPGLPFITMGHNGQIAWAFTVAPVDVFELYRQPRDPEDPQRIGGPEGWQNLLVRSESIEIRGREKALEREFHYTPLGRVIDIEDDHVVTMRWAGFELPLANIVTSGLALNRADNFETFRRAATDMGALSVNWSYSDRDGNIGYVQSTPIPDRRHERFFTVLDATDPLNDWDGFHPPEELPWALNPEQGWLANSNNNAVGEDWPYPVPGFYKHLRMRRISDHLSSRDTFDRADMRRFQLDQRSDRALSWRDWLADVAEESGRSAIASELRQWDGVMRAESDMAGLFQLWWHYLARAVFEPNDGEPGASWREQRPLLDNWLHSAPEEAFPPDVDRDQAALKALEDALKIGIHPLGRIQTLSIRHPLADNALLDAWLDLSRGPVPRGGDAGSLNVSYVGFDPEAGSLQVGGAASMRFVMDWSDPDAFTLNLTFGQSGNPFSPHFDDFFDDFLTGDPWVVPWSRSAVEERIARQLVLRP
ncbi:MULTISPECIES: penicillin acylase family protein [unclassified Wenzhouxiangella]|uniref:penicillin acylase family protein n=1 Tax=unclassified Wenzhouxiangella TaxID=2613841 RepID=UPI0015F27F03|nr:MULTISPECIES: penicillin acylase family protein [unclassified Wenzhouxiangella]